MGRKLPWKDNPASRTIKEKEPAKDDGARISASNDEDLTGETGASVEESDHSDDEKYRMTESEFMDTARFFTKELHQQAYDRLLHEQKKEIDTSNSLTDLLDKPVPQAGSKNSVLNHAILESKSKPEAVTKLIEPQSGTNPSERSYLSSIAKPSDIQGNASAILLSKTSAADPASISKEKYADPKPTTTTKLSSAAIARRQKRQQARKADSAAVPSF